MKAYVVEQSFYIAEKFLMGSSNALWVEGPTLCEHSHCSKINH